MKFLASIAAAMLLATGLSTGANALPISSPAQAVADVVEGQIVQVNGRSFHGHRSFGHRGFSRSFGHRGFSRGFGHRGFSRGFGHRGFSRGGFGIHRGFGNRGFSRGFGGHRSFGHRGFSRGRGGFHR